MPVIDPIADMLTRIRNAQGQGKTNVVIPGSKLKAAVLKVMQEEGYIGDVQEETTDKGFRQINVALKYYQGKPVITRIGRVSKPGLRKYSPASEIPMVANGLGITIVTTSQGVMTDTHARSKNVGGEVLCQVL
ncbi:MAG: 30S ribosomal protein S8 [Alphaproteobacteria bacterium CG_4_10_14_0_8_um_filter_53_9]|nr:MAG: 30S ribosomal protein S8 [Alphaproteobacteria bacterium CG_4_10_14_0_8_um_filter_53_9]